MLEEITQEKKEFFDRLFHSIKERGMIRPTNLSTYKGMILNYRNRDYDVSKYLRKIKYYENKNETAALL